MWQRAKGLTNAGSPDRTSEAIASAVEFERERAAQSAKRIHDAVMDRIELMPRHVHGEPAPARAFWKFAAAAVFALGVGVTGALVVLSDSGPASPSVGASPVNFAREAATPVRVMAPAHKIEFHSIQEGLDTITEGETLLIASDTPGPVAVDAIRITKAVRIETTSGVRIGQGPSS